MSKKKAPAGPTMFLVWDPQNNLVHGVHHDRDAAEHQILGLAAQAAPHGALHIVEAPGVGARPEIATDDLDSLAVRAQ